MGLFGLSDCHNAPGTSGSSSVNAARPLTGCVPATTDHAWYLSDNQAPLFEDLEGYDCQLKTKNEMAQRYFNQGMVLAYGFNHAEAARSFYYASKLDPDCAMPYWGYAYVLGPNYNAGMERDNYQRAYEAIQKARALAADCSPKERALIEALTKRYVANPIEDRRELDIAYANAMKNVADQYPNDADIQAIYAEALMDLHPWDLWDKDGKAKEWTPEILERLKQAMQADPEHIGAHHFYIHAVEASQHPEAGLVSAQLFDDDKIPGAGHLVHMPAHIYIRTGDYHKGTLANIRAVKVDSLYTSACHAQGAYPLAYYPHNYHFMAGTATLEGNSKWALLAADKVSEQANRDIMIQPGWSTLQHYYSIPYYVKVKFGKWDELLTMENHDPQLKYPAAVRHYARGMAYLGKNQLDAAKSELARLKKYAADESLKEITVWDINSVHSLMQIARRVLEGEIKAREGKYDESILLLTEAVVIEDQLNYDEPPDWFFSVRHHLGAVLNEAGRYEEAIATYEEDLARLPKNGWALHGMKLAYQQLDDEAMLADVEGRLALAWATADIELENSRLK